MGDDKLSPMDQIRGTVKLWDTGHELNVIERTLLDDLKYMLKRVDQLEAEEHARQMGHPWSPGHD